MNGKELEELALKYYEGNGEAATRLTLLQPGLVAAIVLMLKEARQFRGNGRTHKLHEIVGTGSCWICGKDFGDGFKELMVAVIGEKATMMMTKEDWFALSEPERRALLREAD